jgi:RNA-splicing ligase RtcB
MERPCIDQRTGSTGHTDTRPVHSGVAEEAPGAYKDVDLVAEATEQGGLARRVAFLRPNVCVKG